MQSSRLPWHCTQGGLQMGGTACRWVGWLARTKLQCKHLMPVIEALVGGLKGLSVRRPTEDGAQVEVTGRFMPAPQAVWDPARVAPFVIKQHLLQVFPGTLAVLPAHAACKQGVTMGPFMQDRCTDASSATHTPQAHPSYLLGCMGPRRSGLSAWRLLGWCMHAVLCRCTCPKASVGHCHIRWDWTTVGLPGRECTGAA